MKSGPVASVHHTGYSEAMQRATLVFAAVLLVLVSHAGLALAQTPAPASAPSLDDVVRGL